MRVIALSDFHRMRKDEVLGVLPALITIEGEVEMVIVKPSDIIVIGDMHPRVQAQLRALEQKARMGMPPPEKIYPPSRE